MVLIVPMENAVNVKIHVNHVMALILLNVQTVMWDMYSLIIHVLNVLYSLVHNAALLILLFVFHVLIIITCILQEIVIYAMMGVKNVIKVETVLCVRLDIIYLDMRMVQWFVKVVYQDVEIVNIGQVNVHNVFQGFILLHKRHAVHVNKVVGNAILLKFVFIAIKLKS